jgi:hypothetical protein
LAFLLLSSQIAFAQSDFRIEQPKAYGGKYSFFVNTSFSPNSSHLLIGSTYDRKITQFGFGYEHKVSQNRLIRAAFEGSILPVFLESDPTTKGSFYVAYPNAPTTYVFFSPVRTLGTVTGTIPVATVFSTYGFVNIYPINGPRQTTYAFAALPIGGRLNGLPHSRIQPTFAVNLGALYAARNVPIDDTSSFNFLAYAGPGVEVFLSHRRSLRFEYLYEHLSNANLGNTNPGIDSGTFRLTVSRHR